MQGNLDRFGGTEGWHDTVGRLTRGLAIVLTALSLSACATLPSSGPTGSQIVKSAREDVVTPGGIDLVELRDFSSLPSIPQPAAQSTLEAPAPPTDLIGPGDVLDIAIYETGVTLFGSAARLPEGSSPFDASAKAEKLPPLRVDDRGSITLPYAGRIQAAGRTTSDLAAQISKALRGMSQNPQVLVSIREGISNSIIIGGEVARPGRLVLPTDNVRLSDTIALAGGNRGEAKDLTVRVDRQDNSMEYRLSDILGGGINNPKIFPGDKITLLRTPRTFAVMGGAGRVEQIPFSGPSVSLAEAIALSGGANPELGDPGAIFVFRFRKDADGKEAPVVYHLDMTKAGAFFLAQRFSMRNEDVLYIGNARANQPSKLVQIISQLFAPVVMVRELARTTGN